MHQRHLGRSGLKISALTLGTMSFGGGGKFANVGTTDLEGARRQIDLCLDAGINLIDTADVYSDGLSEEIVGEAVKDKRDDLLLATKVRFSMGPHENDEGLSRHHIIRGCEDSLRRLQTDWIDLYQVHEWDGSTPLEETLGALQTLVDSGKVRYVGVSNFAGWQLMKALGHRRARPAAELRLPADLLLAAGALGRVRADPGRRRSGARDARLEPARGGSAVGQVPARTRMPRRARAISPSGTSRRSTTRTSSTTRSRCCWRSRVRTSVSAAQVALAWLLTRPSVASVVIGARTDEQLADNLRAAELELSADELSRLEQVSRPDLIYPYWHQMASAADRLSPADLALIRPYLG